MAMEHYFKEAEAQNHLKREDKSSLYNSKSTSDAAANANGSPPGGFDCNICLDSVQDPVVTLCGHLYCWPCIYKWLHFQSISTEDQDQKQQQCPVCKAEVSPSILVPLYGRGQATKTSNGKAPQLGLVIPKRPLGPICGIDSPRPAGTAMIPHLTPQLRHHNHLHNSRLYYSQPGSSALSSMLGSGGITANLFDPLIGMLGEMVYTRVLGNSITNFYAYPNSYHPTGSTNPRMRRHVMEADKSLNRICFFLFCCVVLCLLLF